MSREVLQAVEARCAEQVIMTIMLKMRMTMPKMMKMASMLLFQVREAEAQAEREREGRQGQLEDLHR